MLEIKSLFVKAGSFLLEDVSLSLQQGECHVILGPTGGGKTLLLESVIGLRKPLSGSVMLRDRDITFLPAEKRGMAYVPQDLAVFPHLTVRENLLYGLKMKRIRKRATVERLHELVDAVEIGHLMERYPKNLSGGERQRVALVRAVACEPELLFLDEPFSALNESLRKDLWFTLKSLQREYGLSILMITHHLEEAFFLGDALSILMGGKVRCSGRSQDVYSAPVDCEVAAFMGIKNFFHGEVKAVRESAVSIYCRELNTSFESSLTGLTAKAHPTVGQKVQLGIRSEEVRIYGAMPIMGNGAISLEGDIQDIIGKGATHLVLFAPRGGAGFLEVEVSNQDRRELKLARGKHVHARFDKRSVFPLFS